jgi:hypothetical protein
VSIADSRTVRLWLAEKRVGPEEKQDLLVVMERFCSFTGVEPDEMIQECFKAEGGLNYKKRRHYISEIQRFTDGLPGEARSKIQSGNVVRSFFIHNGVRLSAPAAPWIG